MSINNGGIEAINPDETALASVRRHPFGLIVIYVEVLIGVLAAGALIYFLAPAVLGVTLSPTLNASLGIGVFLIAVLALLLLAVATQIYNQNRLIITSKNITQIRQAGLFNRQVSELSMANVEDVTAAQTGIFAHMFGYGELRVETAGEQNNFKFIYCPKPNYYGKMILDARQKYVQNPSAGPATIPAVQPPTPPAPQPPVPPAPTA